MKELEEFADAFLLMDDRRKIRRGQDGAMQVNARLLRQHAQRISRLIVAIRAFRDGFAEVQGRLARWGADDFRGMPSVLELCEGAWVLLTLNLWVEVGLMNGALGRVIGFVWPEGGDPASSDSARKSPFCVIVEFDEVNLGTEVDPLRPGCMRSRSCSLERMTGVVGYLFFRSELFLRPRPRFIESSFR